MVFCILILYHSIVNNVKAG